MKNIDFLRHREERTAVRFDLCDVKTCMPYRGNMAVSIPPEEDI